VGKKAVVYFLSATLPTSFEYYRKALERNKGKMDTSKHNLILKDYLNENKFAIHKTQQNTYKPKTIKWAYWVMGRLGGWKADNKQRKAGPITLQKGLIKFYEIFEGWKLHKNNT
jgi:hypothetical protein